MKLRGTPLRVTRSVAPGLSAGCRRPAVIRRGRVAEREYRWLDHHPRELPLVWPRTGGTAGGRDEETCEKNASFGLGGRSPSPSRCRSNDVRRAAREGQHGASMERIHARTVLTGPQWVRTRPPATRLVRITRYSTPTHPLVWPSPF